MNRLFLAAALMALSVLPAMAETDNSSLEFMVGNWSLETWFLVPGGEKMEATAQLKVEAILDGSGVVMQERHEPQIAGRPPFHETMVLGMDPRTDEIEGASVNSLGNRKLNEGAFEGDQLVLEQSGEMFGGKSGRNRLTWTRITPDQFTLQLDRFDETTGQWQKAQYGYVANRTNE